MIIRASSALRNDYAGISELAKKTKEPIYITKNGDGDLVVMDIDAFEQYRQILELRAKVLDAEEEWLKGHTGVTIAEARMQLQG